MNILQRLAASIPSLHYTLFLDGCFSPLYQFYLCTLISVLPMYFNFKSPYKENMYFIFQSNGGHVVKKELVLLILIFSTNLKIDCKIHAGYFI